MQTLSPGSHDGHCAAVSCRVSVSGRLQTFAPAPDAMARKMGASRIEKPDRDASGERVATRDWRGPMGYGDGREAQEPRILLHLLAGSLLHFWWTPRLRLQHSLVSSHHHKGRKKRALIAVRRARRWVMTRTRSPSMLIAMRRGDAAAPESSRQPVRGRTAADAGQGLCTSMSIRRSGADTRRAPEEACPGLAGAPARCTGGPPFCFTARSPAARANRLRKPAHERVSA